MTRLLTALAAVVLMVPAACAADLPEGNWRLAQVFGAGGEQRLCVLKVAKKDGKLSATVTDSLKPPARKGVEPKAIPVKIDAFSVAGDKVHLAIEIAGQKQTFEATINPKDSKVLYGWLGDEKRASKATLTMQDGEKLEPLNAADRPRPPEPYLGAMKLNSAPIQFQIRAQQSKDANEKAELLAEAKKARQEADEKMPPLYKETFDKHADSPFAVEAASALIRTAAKTKAGADDVAKWAKRVDEDAAKFGDRIARDTALGTAEALNIQKGYETIALAEATRATAGLTDKAPLAFQEKALRALATAQAKAGKANEAKETEGRLAKVSATLDAEYQKTVPPFTPEKYAGRKDGANRVVVMELFTGAACPPCVAADAAFDGLEKTYGPKDLILVQYHMHIPGPDPMANPDTIARWDWYREKFDQEVRGVPSSLFNGKPQSGGGGPMDFSKQKYTAYREIIDKALQEKTDLKIGGSAKRASDKVHIDLSVDGAKDAGDKARLVVLVAEEKVKYAGPNGMRFHHQVVRAIPGGAAGSPVTAKKSFDVDLAELKKSLTKYLDTYEKEERPFANPAKPLDLAHLRVIAMVQNSDTGEILNAAEFEVEGK